MRPLLAVEVLLILALAPNLSSKEYHEIIATAGTLETFKKARERAGFWWLVFAAAMIVLAISLIALALVLYLFIRSR